MLILDHSCSQVEVDEAEVEDLFRSVNKLELSVEGYRAQFCEAFICGSRVGGLAQVIAALYQGEDKRCLVYASDNVGADQAEYDEALQEAIEFLEPLGFQMKRVHLTYGAAMRQVIFKGVSGLRLGSGLVQKWSKQQGEPAKKRSRKGGGAAAVATPRVELSVSDDFWPQEKEAQGWTGAKQVSSYEPAPVKEITPPEEPPRKPAPEMPPRPPEEQPRKPEPEMAPLPPEKQPRKAEPVVPSEPAAGSQTPDRDQGGIIAELRQELEQARSDARKGVEEAAATEAGLRREIQSLRDRTSHEEEKVRQELQGLRRELEDSALLVKELRDAVREGEEREAGLREEGEELKTRVAELQNDLGARERDREAELRGLKKRLTELEAELKARDVELKEKDAELKEKDTELKKKDNELKEKEQEFAGERDALKLAIVSREKELQESKEHILALEEEQGERNKDHLLALEEAEARMASELHLQRTAASERLAVLKSFVDRLWQGEGGLDTAAADGLASLLGHETTAAKVSDVTVKPPHPSTRERKEAPPSKERRKGAERGMVTEQEPEAETHPAVVTREASPVIQPVIEPVLEPMAAPPPQIEDGRGTPPPVSGQEESAPPIPAAEAAEPEPAPASPPPAPDLPASVEKPAREATVAVVTVVPVSPQGLPAEVPEPLKFEPADFGSFEEMGDGAGGEAIPFVLQGEGVLPPLAVADLLELYRSANVQRVAPAGGSPVEGTASVCRCRRGGQEMVAAIIRLVKDGGQFIYAPAREGQAGQSLVRSAISFLEDIGFLMLPEELPQEPAARREALAALKIFQGVDD